MSHDLDALQTRSDHVVDRIASGATDTDHFDPNGGHDILFK